MTGEAIARLIEEAARAGGILLTKTGNRPSNLGKTPALVLAEELLRVWPQ